MAELKVYLPDDLDQQFRKTAMAVYGYGRGSLSKAAVEAFSKWCDGREQSTTTVGEGGGPLRIAAKIEVKPRG